MIKILSRIIKKLTKKIVVAILAIVVIAVPLIYLTILNSKQAQAAWFDDNWAYRKAIPVTNNTSQENNVYIQVTIDTSDTTKFQTDCGDLRFTKQNGDLLSYWLISGCGTSSTVINVEFDAFPAGAQTIYYYYGNPSATNSSKDLTTGTFYAGAGDGSINNENANWATAHDATDGITASVTGTTLMVDTTENYWGGDAYIIERGFLPVNTSGIPDNAIITAATLNLYNTVLFSNLTPTYNWITVVQTSQADSTTLVAGDYDQLGTTEGVDTGNRIGYDSLVLDSYNTITLNATGRGWINKTGTSLFGLRAGHDILNSAIATNTARSARFSTSEASGTSTDPYLSTTYYVSSISTAASNYTVGSTGSEEKAPGPKLYWQFDDPSAGSGLVAQDSSSNNLDGTLNNTPAWNTEDLCIDGKCLYFDGSNNENVSKSDDAKLDFAAADNFTLSAWVRKSGAASANTVILGKASANIGATYQGYKLYMDSSGDFCFDTQDGTLAVDTACTSGVEFDDDKWHLVQGVKTGTTNITLYVDGKQRAQDASIASTGSLANSGTFYAGIDSDGLAIEWKGFIDEVKVYDYARSQAQINADYSSRGSSKGVSARMGGGDMDYLSQGLVGYWKMDESSGNASDSSGNGLTLTNNSVMAYAAGKFGNSAQCDGTADYFNTATTISGIQTVSFWVYPAAAANNYFINLINSSAYITINSSGVVSATGFTSPSIYVNNTLNGTVTAAAWNLVTITTGTAINANAFAVGLTNDGSNNFCTNTSKIDEVRLYNRALSTKEISDLYNFAPGPVGYWNLEEGTGQNVNDLSSYANTATLGANSSSGSDDPAWSTGKFGKALSFDGSNDYVNVPYNGVLNTNSALTLSAWIKTTSTSRVDIISRYAAASPNQGYSLTLAPSYTCGSAGQVGLWVGDNTNKFLCTTNTVNDGKWHYITGTYDGTTAAIYVDGVSQASGSRSNSLSETAQSLKIGASGDLLFYGNTAIDDVKIYNYARTQKQIVSDMNASHPAVGSPVGSAVGHWKFDGGADNTCLGGTNDACNSGSAGSALDGAETGMAVPATATSGWTQAGKFGKALNFDGTNDYVQIPDNSALDLTNFTLSSWVNFSSVPSGTDDRYIMERGTSGANTVNFYLWVDANGSTSGAGVSQIVYGFRDSGNTAWKDHFYNFTPTGSTWYHLGLTFDGSNIKLYVNGAEVDSETETSTPNTSGTQPLNIGANKAADTALNFFPGTIDEVKIYSFALTQDEILTDYNRGSSLILGALGNLSTLSNQAAGQEYCVPGDTSSCAAPVGRWDFEEKKDQSAFDTSGTANTATLGADSSAASDDPTWTQGKKGAALSFDGSNDLLTVSDAGSLDLSSSFTLEAWALWNGTSADYYIIQKGVASGTSNYYLWWNNTSLTPNTSLVCGFYGGGGWRDHIYDWTPTIGQWYNIVCVFDDSGNTLKIYLDGKEVLSEAETNSPTADAGGLRIGREVITDGDSFSGKLDNIRIFNYARSAAQAALDYNRGAPVGHWKLDDCQGSTTQDSSPSAGSGQAGNNGTITIGASGTQTAVGTCTGSANTAWKDGATGKRNASLDFDGTDDYISVTDTANLRFDASTADFSLFAWVKRTTTGTEYIISKEDADNDGYRLLFTSSNTVQCSEDATDVTSTSTITDTNWHLVGCTIDRDGNGQVYIDGKADGSAGSMGTDAMATTSNITLGTRSYTSTSYLNGQIDDVKVFNYALTGTQVKELYNQGAVFFGPSTGSP